MRQAVGIEGLTLSYFGCNVQLCKARKNKKNTFFKIF